MVVSRFVVEGDPTPVWAVTQRGAGASLEELLEDYRDFLRIRDLRLWAKGSREALYVRGLGSTPDASYETYRTYVETRPPEVVANIVVCLIHQTNYLLDRQLRQLEQAFVEQGGLRERMTRAPERTRPATGAPSPKRPSRRKTRSSLLTRSGRGCSIVGLCSSSPRAR